MHAPEAAGASWADDFKAYERSRREVDARFVAHSTKPLDSATLVHAERRFDPLLQRFTDEGREAAQRRHEDTARVQHLNLAADVQLRREQTFNVLTNKSKLKAIDARADELPSFVRQEHPMPSTCVDYNIVSNMPFEAHHWARPEDRPHMVERSARPRKVPAVNKKDFNPLTNRYLDKHEEKTARDKTLSLLEATTGLRKTSAFNPLVGQFAEPRQEECARTMEHAQTVEAMIIAEAHQPVVQRSRQTAFYDMVSHRVKDPEALRTMDAAEEARKARFRKRHVNDRVARHRDYAFQDAQTEQKLSAIAHERFLEAASRGYDIVTNASYGDRPGQRKLYEPAFTKPTGESVPLWERMHTDNNASGVAKPLAGRLSATVRGSELGGSGGAVANPLLPPPAPASARGSAPVPTSARGGSGRSGCQGRSAPPAAPQALSAREARSGGAPPAPAVPGAASSSAYSRPRA